MPHNKKKLFIQTYGCQMNEYDSLKIAKLMAKTLDFIITKNIEEADLIIFNTCSIREKAQHKIFSELGLLRELKQQKPELVIAVGGCVASQEKENITRREPMVNIVFGPQTWQSLPDFYTTYLATKTRIINTEFKALEKFSCLANLAETKAQFPVAYVSIMEGCNNFCSYCVVPYTRGREISRTFSDVMQEVTALAHQGVKEINFLGQNVNNYRSTNPDGHISNLASLIRATVQIPQISRIRFTTSHPAHFDDELITLYANETKLVSYVHLPVQSGSNRILKAMRRNYTHEEYREIIHKLRQIRPNITISTDFIVGFPGETEEDFADTMELANTIGFDISYSFMYSQRPRTLSAKLKDDVPLNTKKQRLYTLQKILNTSAAKISKNMIGTIQKVIVTDFSRKDKRQLFGRTANNRIVNFTASADLIGHETTVKITAVLTNSLQGELA